MHINFKKKQEWIFIISGVLVLLAIIAFFMYSINFLVRNLNSALSADSIKKTPITRFNIEGLKKLGIME
ncbi:MAG TPA: hypothetical protein ENH35_03595 [Candidatus Moranbacteria bacterium]|nr:hypothetical protein [Candidatus Moranbacteria bacterium]